MAKQLGSMVEHRKTKSTQPNCPTRCPTLYLILETWPEAPFIAEFLLENISEMIAEQELEEAVIDLWAPMHAVVVARSAFCVITPAHKRQMTRSTHPLDILLLRRSGLIGNLACMSG